MQRSIDQSKDVFVEYPVCVISVDVLITHFNSLKSTFLSQLKWEIIPKLKLLSRKPLQNLASKIKVKMNFSTFRALRCILVPSYAMAKFSSTKKLLKARCPLLRAVCWCNVAREFFAFLYSLHSGWMQWSLFLAWMMSLALVFYPVTMQKWLNIGSTYRIFLWSWWR